jgi:hypothetical protein
MAVDTPARVAVLGAGPIGIEVALYARYLGYDVDLFERDRIASNVFEWGHERMFTPFGENCSTLGLAALAAQDPDYVAPEREALLTGHQWAEQYLVPLSLTDLLADHVQERTTVLAVSRDHHLNDNNLSEEPRAESPFRILTRDQSGEERESTAEVVVDVTGVYGNPNWTGQGGAHAQGETSVHEPIEYAVHDALGTTPLLNPEPNLYILGSKSCGRDPSFLYSVGLQQIRELFTIVGGREDLDLYETLKSLAEK